MNSSFQSDIEELLSLINNGKATTVKETYDYYLGEGSFDELIKELNRIEDNYMTSNKYDSNSLLNIGESITNLYEMILNDKIEKENIDIRVKDVELDDFSSKIKGIINNRVKGEDINVQNKARSK